METKKTVREKWDDFKTGAKNRWYRTCDWCRGNKDILLPTVLLVAVGSLDLTKEIVKANRTNDEKALKERYIYDRSNGHYYECKRKVKNREWAEIDARHQLTGEPVGQILQDMRLLK